MRQAPTQHGLFDLILPDEQAEWDAWPTHERERTEAIVETLSPGATLWDIGSEHGSQSALYQKYAGARLVLVEPTRKLWPNIRRTWEANGLEMPVACVVAFAGAELANAPEAHLAEWPLCAQGPEASTSTAYAPLLPSSPSVRLDDLCTAVGSPQGVTIDVEGHELAVLEGAGLTLEMARPVVWVSVHTCYGVEPEHVVGLMAEAGYRAQLLGVDHEEHWQFVPEEAS